MKIIEVEWCKNWIKKTFAKLPEGITGIEVGTFWKKAEREGLWIKGTYGTHISDALAELTEVKVISENGNFLYNVFKLK